VKTKFVVGRLPSFPLVLCRFKEFVQARTLHELATKEEVAGLRPSVQAQAEKDAVDAVKKSAEATAAHVERIKAADAEAAKAAEAHAAASQALQAASQAAQATAVAAQQAQAGAMHPGSPQDAIVAAREAAEAAATAAAEVGSKSTQEASAKVAADAAAATAAELRANAPPDADTLMRGEPLPHTAPQARSQTFSPHHVVYLTVVHALHAQVLRTWAVRHMKSLVRSATIKRCCTEQHWWLACFSQTRARAQVQVTDEMLKAAWAALREQAAARSKEAVAVIKPFEDGIRRPYFHVKALDSAQLVNWSRYLDFAERSGAREQVVKLYERCLVACAGYPGEPCLYADTRKPQALPDVRRCDRLCSDADPVVHAVSGVAEHGRWAPALSVV
jgi:pre-mRNA-processing factor 39